MRCLGVVKLVMNASPPKIQEGEVYDGTSPWEFKGA